VLATSGLALVMAYLALRILTVPRMRDSIPGMVLLTVAGGFGIAKAMAVTGEWSYEGPQLTVYK
jgi:hypothetical protein